MEEHLVKPGESVDQCAKRYGLRCLTRAEIRAGAIGTAIIYDPSGDTFEAVPLEGKDG